MTSVILDTSAIYPDFRFRKRSTQALLEYGERVGIEAVVPQVVVEELKNRFRKDATKHIKEIDDAARKLHDNLGITLAPDQES